MKLFRISSLALIGVPRSSIRRISSCPGNLEKYRIAKLINEQSIESVIEETVEIYQNNDPQLKFLTLFLFTFRKLVNTNLKYKIIETKIKEVIIRTMIHYFIHDIFCMLKCYISIN